ncbi:MAG TPA: capsule biosynthesis protein, partial [Prevotellaceae bacterium]|nr:capsule biosynthesis protein [Prevotellaceae bacterium]
MTMALVSVNAQMTDEQVIDYAKQQNAKGMSQQQIATDLIKRGVTQQQFERIKKNIENRRSSTSENTSQEINRTRISNGETNITKQTDEDEVLQENDSIKIFGHDIFRSKKLSFEPNMNVATPATYVLGPGDEVILDIYGLSQSSNKYKISPDGTVTIEKIGPINISGLNVSQAQAKVQRKISGYYQGSSIKLALGQTRTIMVNVMGEVAVPGTYTLSAFATVFHALYMAGGVNDIGTLRDIQVSRNGKIITTVDIYDYILNGRLSGNVMLRENDVILVGPYKNLVKAEGKVKRPMYYEMKENESLQSLIAFTGGFTGDAYKQKIRVERKSNEGLTVHNIDEWDFGTFHLEDGDDVVVGSVIERYKNTVKVTGAVFRPGQYKIGSNVNSVKSLIEQAGGLLENAFGTRAVLHRMKADRTLQTISINLNAILASKVPDVALQNEDELIITSTEKLNESRFLSIYGEVYNPGEYPYSEGETVEDLITEAGGLNEMASLTNVEVARRITSEDDNVNGNKLAKIFSLTLNDGLSMEKETAFKLQPYDIVTIHRNPAYQEQKSVIITGEVKYAGRYILSSKEERISDIVKRAGGVTDKASVVDAQLIRKISNQEEDLKFRKLEVAPTKQDSIEIQNALLKNNYNIGFDLEKALNNPHTNDDIVLAENDSIFIPQLNNTVKISGEVMFPNTVSYIKGKNSSYYINQAGGVAKGGKKSQTYIVYANGQV